MAQLGIMPEAFYDLSPKEFYHAMKSIGESRQAEMRLHFEAARYNAGIVVNYTSTILKERIVDIKRAFPLYWDPKVTAEPQTQEELNKALLGIASAFKAVQSDRKPGDPPTVLAQIHRR